MSPSELQRIIAGVEEASGYRFRDRRILLEALTHKSFYHEHRGGKAPYNERLEFLGDAVIGLIVVEALFLREERFSEAVLAKVKSYLVSEPVFAGLAPALGLDRAVLLGKGESSTGGRKKPSILANAFEALIGAVYLDGGFEDARQMVLGLFAPVIEETIREKSFEDAKTELQERTQAAFGVLPEYRLLREQGEDHERVFTVAVYLEGKKLATASGKRKKEAETLAARKALLKIG